MKDIYLHIGTEKTGTTSVQEFLRNNRVLLEREGIDYPKVGYGREPLAHFKLVAPLCALDDPNPSLDFVPHCDFTADEAWEELAECIRKSHADKIVISAEHFSSRLGRNGVDYIKRFFDELGFVKNVYVVVYFRHHSYFIPSAYSTLIKSGGVVDFPSFLLSAKNKKKYFDYLGLLELWASRFGENNVIVSSYDRAVNHEHGIQGHFLDLIGARDYSDYDFSGKVLNISLGSLGSIIGREINYYFSEDRSLDQKDRLPLINVCSSFLKNERGVIYTQDDHKEIVDIFGGDYRLIDEKYNNGEKLIPDIDESIFSCERAVVDEKVWSKLLHKLWKLNKSSGDV